MPRGKHVLSMPQGKHVFGTVNVGEKGQIVIPKDARNLFRIDPGDTLLVLGDEETGLIVSKPEAVHDLAKTIFEKMKPASEGEE